MNLSSTEKKEVSILRKSGFKVMMQLVGLVKPLLHIMSITIIMGVIGFLCSIFITILGGLALLGVLGMDIPYSVNGLLITVVLLALIRGALRYAEQASGHYIAFRLLAVIRNQVFATLRRLAPAKLEGKDKGNLISIITTDIEFLEVFYAHTIAPVTIGILTSIILIIFIGQYHIILAIVAAIAYIVVGYVIPQITSSLGREDGRQYRAVFGNLNSYILDSLRGLRETIQYDAGEDRMKAMLQMSDDLDALQERLKYHEGRTRAVTDTAILSFSLLMLFISSYLYSQSAVSFSGVFICTIAMMSSFGPVVALSNLSNNLLQTLASGERVLSLLEETPAVEEVKHGVSPCFNGATCENVNFAYDEEQILSDFNMSIPKNKIIGLVGKSGSGKSTFLKLLMRFWDSKSGVIAISRQDIKSINTSQLRKLEGYVTQETYLFKDSIEANIKLSKPDATHEEVVTAAKKASIHEFIMSLPDGYKTKVSELGESLSGGEKQRLGLARAFLHNAPLLLLDEPTSNLDSLNEAIILKSIKEACDEQTVVLVSHRQSTMNIVDEQYSVENGRVS